MTHSSTPLLEKIVVVGTSGTGKTTLARALSRALDLPHVELDALHWGPDWTERPGDEVAADLAARTGGRGWVVDGNYSRHRPTLWSRADTIIWLNYSFPLTMKRIVTRTARRAILREELWSGNRETLSKALSRDSIVLWSASTWARRRREYPELARDLEDTCFIELTHPREADGVLALARALGARARHEEARP
jgi:adenylate kinase family enzyme